MRHKFTQSNIWIVLLAVAISINSALAETVLLQQDSTTIRKPRNKSYLRNGLPFTLPPLKPGVVSSTKVNINRQDDKILTNVQLYPNPATDQFNVSYEVSRNSIVTIKIVDVLGNDLATIFSQRVEAGDQKFTYAINSKLSRGFYFVRITAGTESTIKRLSIL